MDRADNIVSFPNGKYTPNFTKEELGVDPLEELLNEFSHFKDDDLWADEDEEETELEASENELTAQHEINELDIFGLNALIGHQLESLEDLTLRLNYYLGEIDLYLPEKRRK